MTYDFKCTSCDHKFEHVKKMNDPNPECPKCASEVARFHKSSPTFSLKGQGWTGNNLTKG